jgi:lysophospholipase L1-like esterase
MKKVRVLFQGDSITDAGRDKRNYHNMGNGYPKFASRLIAEAHPEIEFDFINLGISGNRTDQLFDRLYSDCIAFNPDVVSILIGVNDVWHRPGVDTTDEQIEVNYRTILENLKNKTNAKIVMICPFYLDAEKNMHLRDDLKTIIPIVEKLAEKYADVFIPLDSIFAEAMKTQPEPLYYSADGVHPNANGSEFIGKVYADAVLPVIKSLI